MDMNEKLEVKNGKLEPYKEFLDAMTEMFVEHQPKKIVLCAILPDRRLLTAYCGEVTWQDKAIIAHSINSDATMNHVYENAGTIIRIAGEQEGSDGCTGR